MGYNEFLSADDFNPRSREGSDNNSESYREQVKISIHAPVKGATQQYQKK